MLFLACGPFIDESSFWTTVATLCIFKPAAYFAFIQAFRYRVTSPTPLTYRRAAKLTAYRAGLGIILVTTGIGALFVLRSDALIVGSWVYLYVGRLAAWFAVGRWGALLRGRRLLGWTVSGTLVNAALDVAFVSGILSAWLPFCGLLLGVVACIGLLHVIGRRQSLKARFTGRHCPRCQYDLTGNRSGRCPECGDALRHAA